MNLVLMCSGCGNIFRVLQQDGGTDVDALVGTGSEFWPSNYRCPRCPDSRPTAIPEENLPRGSQTKDIVDLTAEEMLACQYGLGLPKDMGTEFEDVEGVFLSQTVARVVGHDVPNTGRCVIDHIVFEDGSIMHLGASSHGAVVYRMVRLDKYAERLGK